MSNPIVDELNAATEFVKALSPLALPFITAAGIYFAGRATANATAAKTKAEQAQQAAIAAAAAASVATARVAEVKATQGERIALSDAKFGQLDEVTNQVNFLSNGGGDQKIDARMVAHGVIDDRRTQVIPVEIDRRGQGEKVIQSAMPAADQVEASAPGAPALASSSAGRATSSV